MLARPGKELEAEVRGFEQRELGRATAMLARLRAVAAAGLLAFGLLTLAFDARDWHGWTLIVASAVLLALTLRDARQHAVSFSPRRSLYYVSTVLGFQTVFIAITGGIQSPLILLYIPVAIVSAFVLGQARLFGLFAAFPVALVWLFTLGQVTGVCPLTPPRYLQPLLETHHRDAYALTMAFVISGVVLLGGFLGIFLRRAIDRAAYAATLARHEAVATMRERNRELLELSGALAHELKNPLASITGLAGLMGRRLPEGSREAEQAGVLLSEARRMASILDEFLNFSRPVAALAPDSIDARALVHEIVTLHEGLAAGRGIDIRADVGDVPPITGDGRKLRQVLVNLLQNAVDASPDGGVVRVGARRADGGGVIFEVEDAGAGLDAQVRGRLFTPGATSKAAGSGLGLVIARTIAEQHGGSLALEERAEGGVRARLSLPAEAAR